MRQISASIDEADWQKQFYSRQLVAWQTRMICSWMVKLTPDMEPKMAKQLLEEASEISLDGMSPTQTSNEGNKASKVTQSVPTRKDFYDMNDEEIERYLGQGDNGNGSFEALLKGFGRR
jgi:hypothetical protein